MSIKGKLKELTSYLGINRITGTIDYGLAKYYEIVSNTNVKVRPELANVDFWIAFLLNTEQTGYFIIYQILWKKYI